MPPPVCDVKAQKKCTDAFKKPCESGAKGLKNIQCGACIADYKPNGKGDCDKIITTTTKTINPTAKVSTRIAKRASASTALTRTRRVTVLIRFRAVAEQRVTRATEIATTTITTLHVPGTAAAAAAEKSLKLTAAP